MKEGVKYLLLAVASGVVTAIAVQLATKYLEQKAILAARAEIQSLMMAAAQAQAQTTQPQPQPEGTLPLVQV